MFSEYNDVIIPASGETQLDIATAACILKNDVALGGDINIIKSNLNGLFLAYYLKNKKKKEIASLAQGVSVVHLYSSQLKSLSLTIPNFLEQQKIADFLTSVDTKIQQLTRKKALLEKYKKGVMRQNFNQEIRFKDDDGNDYPEWRITKLGAIGEIIGGGTPDTSVAEFWGGEISWFTPTEIKSKYIDKSIRTITEKGLKQSSAKILPKGSLLLSSRATVGDIGIALNECCTNQGFQSIVVNNDNENEFIYYWVINNKKAFLCKASGSTFLEINKTEISKLKLLRPSKKEQEKIAKLLSSIDKKIDLVNQQLKKCHAFKKGLLQQMFV